MTLPRPLTVAERVKKLEEAVKQIRLVPSTTQSDVAPLTVKGSVWIDSSAGNEPKYFDGQNWVPVRDETIAVAQSTADTAQATVDPLVPLTDLAGQTSGTVITGATQASSGTGPRVVINDPAYPGQIVMYTDSPDEVEPARIFPIVSGTTAYMRFVGPKTAGMSGTPATFDLNVDAIDDERAIELDADTYHLFSSATWIDGFNALKLGDGTDYITIHGQAISDADLSDPSNTFPASLATVTGAQTLTNKDLSSPTNTFPGLVSVDPSSWFQTGWGDLDATNYGPSRAWYDPVRKWIEVEIYLQRTGAQTPTAPATATIFSPVVVASAYRPQYRVNLAVVNSIGGTENTARLTMLRAGETNPGRVDLVFPTGRQWSTGQFAMIKGGWKVP